MFCFEILEISLKNKHKFVKDLSFNSHDKILQNINRCIISNAQLKHAQSYLADECLKANNKYKQRNLNLPLQLGNSFNLTMMFVNISIASSNWVKHN